MKLKSYCLIIISLFFCKTVRCQELDSSPIGVMISHGHPKGGWMLNYTYMNILMKKNLSGTSTVSDDAIWNNYIYSPQHMNMDMHMLMGMYGLTGRLSIMLSTCYLNNNMLVTLPPGTVLVHNHGGGSGEMSNETTHNHLTSGMGDVKFWTLYKLLNGEGSSVVLSGGINIPTGNIKIAAGEHALIPNEHHSYMMQLGTGSVDLMPGVTYFKKHKKMSWSAQVLGTIRAFNNKVGYRYGNDITLNLWSAYRFCPYFTASIRAEGFNAGRIKGSDPLIYATGEPDSDPKNYGGTRANVYGGVNFYINKGFMYDSKIGIEYGLPFYQQLNGPQLSVQQTLNIGITKSF